MQEKLQLLEQIKATNFNELECRLWVIKKNTYKGKNTYKTLYAAIDGLDGDLKNTLEIFLQVNKTLYYLLII